MSGTLCWTCQNYASCDWGRYNPDKKEVNFEPVAGWDAKEVHRIEGGRRVDTFVVRKCPEYLMDERTKSRIQFYERAKYSEKAKEIILQHEDELAKLPTRERLTKKRELFAEAGLCRCGKEIDNKNFRTCANCRKLGEIRRIKYSKNNKEA